METTFYLCPMKNKVYTYESKCKKKKTIFNGNFMSRLLNLNQGYYKIRVNRKRIL